MIALISYCKISSSSAKCHRTCDGNVQRHTGSHQWHYCNAEKFGSAAISSLALYQYAAAPGITVLLCAFTTDTVEGRKEWIVNMRKAQPIRGPKTVTSP